MRDIARLSVEFVFTISITSKKILRSVPRT